MSGNKKAGKKGGGGANNKTDDLDAILKEIEQETKITTEKQGAKKKNKGKFYRRNVFRNFKAN